jgi:glycosyltransferase involved in cell wall biosynthesis
MFFLFDRVLRQGSGEAHLNILIIGMYPLDSDSVLSGTERVVYNLTQSLSAIPGVSVTVLNPYRFRHFSRRHSLFRHENPRVYQITYAALPYFFRRHPEFQLVNIHGVSLFGFLGLCAGLTRPSIKTIYTAHGLIPLENTLGYNYTKTTEFFEKQLVRRSSFITTVSRQTKKALMQTYGITGKKITVIHNGVNLHDFAPVREMKSGSRETVLLFVGSILPIKGLDFLLAAVSQVQNPPVVLKIVGKKTPYMDILRQKYAHLFQTRRVIFCGSKKQDELRRAYSESDVFLLTSEYDQYPQAVLEAFAMKKPVIISDRVGVKAIMTDGREGFVVPFGNEALLAEKIRSLAENRSLRVKMGKNSRQTAERNSWTTIAGRYLQFFSSIR